MRFETGIYGRPGPPELGRPPPAANRVRRPPLPGAQGPLAGGAAQERGSAAMVRTVPMSGRPPTGDAAVDGVPGDAGVGALVQAAVLGRRGRNTLGTACGVDGEVLTVSGSASTVVGSIAMLRICSALRPAPDAVQLLPLSTRDALKLKNGGRQPTT